MNTTPPRTNTRGREEFLTPSKLRHVRRESSTLWSYVKEEMLGLGVSGKVAPPQTENISNFLQVPLQLESLMFLGCAMCLDSFTYVLTFLPVRVMISIVLLALEVHHWLSNFIFGGQEHNHLHSSTIRFHRTHLYDLMRGIMFLCGVLVLREVNMSQVYHFIRGQNMIKLYVLTSMLEVMDKLCSSFGQDAFDALHTHARADPKSLKLVGYFVVTTSYVILHSLLYFAEVATYTVVVNSSDQALLTVLVLNNFAELKSFVFKKFDVNNIFQLACSDITERFKLMSFLFSILLVAVAQNNFVWNDILPNFLRIAAMMLISESIADSVKHAFINKFNSNSAEIYEDFGFILRLDILGDRRDNLILDNSYAVSRRLGLAQIPLGCVFVRYLLLATSSPAIQDWWRHADSRSLSILVGVSLFLLLAAKVGLGMALLSYANAKQEAVLQQFEASLAEQVDKRTNTSKRKVEMLEELLDIDRYTVYKGRIL